MLCPTVPRSRKLCAAGHSTCYALTALIRARGHLGRGCEGLRQILERFDNGFVRFSDGFSGAGRLLAECETRGIEGIVFEAQGRALSLGQVRLPEDKDKGWRSALSRARSPEG